MRLLDRNKQTVYWRNLTGTTAITTSESGETLETGEYQKTYGTIKSARFYVKSAIGENAAEPFGDFTAKRRTIYALPQETDINEFSLLWIGIDPEIVPPTNAQGVANANAGEPTVPHNFTVDGISYGINHIRIAIRQVEVNG